MNPKYPEIIPNVKNILEMRAPMILIPPNMILLKISMKPPTEINTINKSKNRDFNFILESDELYDSIVIQAAPTTKKPKEILK